MHSGGEGDPEEVCLMDLFTKLRSRRAVGRVSVTKTHGVYLAGFSLFRAMATSLSALGSLRGGSPECLRIVSPWLSSGSAMTGHISGALRTPLLLTQDTWTPGQLSSCWWTANPCLASTSNTEDK